MATKEWRKLIHYFRVHFPISSPVKVRRVKAKKYEGVTYFNGRVFSIRIARDQSDSAQIDALIHEYAHAQAIAEQYAHSELWGGNYAKIYSAWEKDFA